MLYLSAEQGDLIEQLQARRQAAALAEVLAEAWPMVAQRLTERWGAFVEAAMLAAQRRGIAQVADFGRYASLWCLWGAAFEDKPGFEWAQEIAADPRRPPRLKVHQLVHRTRDELRTRGAAAAPPRPGMPPAPTLAQWDGAIDKILAGISRLQAAATVFLDEPLPPTLVPCDLSTLDLKLAELPDHQEYRFAAGGFARQPAPPPPAELVHLEYAPEQPLSLSLLSRPPRQGPGARLNLRVQTQMVCDGRLHPELVLRSAAGPQTWCGRDAAQLAIVLNAPLRPLQPTLPGIAAALPADEQTLMVQSCGLRNVGAPFGGLSVALRVYPAAQWLFDLRHPPWTAMAWPAVAPPEPTPPAALRLECDGSPVDAVAWHKAWQSLQAQFRAGFDKLFNAWTRSTVGSPLLELHAQALTGQAQCSWGYRKIGADDVQLRCEARLDLMACAIELTLSGEIVLGPTRARVHLHLKDQCEWRGTIQQLGAQSAAGQQLADAQRIWRWPFAVEVEPLADPSLALLSRGAAAPEQSGALSGSCGLRPRADGAGWQWFFALRLEPVSVSLQSMDPIAGATSQSLALLPELPLLDWSAG